MLPASLKRKMSYNATLLNKLIKMGYKVAIATVAPKAQWLSNLQSSHLFYREQPVALEDVMQEKPNPEPLLLAQK